MSNDADPTLITHHSLLISFRNNNALQSIQGVFRAQKKQIVFRGYVFEL